MSLSVHSVTRGTIRDGVKTSERRLSTSNPKGLRADSLFSSGDDSGGVNSSQ